MAQVIAKATHEQIKSHNKSIVLRTIYNSNYISRADISRITGLTRATVSEIVGELIEEGLIEECGIVVKGVGKPPTLLSLREDARVFLCVDFSDEVYHGALVNLRGQIRHWMDWPLASSQGEEALRHGLDLIEALRSAAPAPLAGIGVGTPGVVDIERGVIREAVNRGWRDLPLAELLIQRYGLPVFIANDSHMTALAEYRFGVGVGSRSLIAIKISQGIGSGVILDGHLLGGDSHAAGEIGHMVIREDGAPCTCGNRGCLETVASLRALVQRAQEEAARHPDSRLAALQAERGSIGLREIQTALQEGDPLTRALVVEAGRAIGLAVAAMVSVLDVERIVLCGEGAALGPVLLDAVRAEVRRRILPRIAEHVEIHLSQLGKEAVIWGASAMMIARFFQLD